MPAQPAVVCDVDGSICDVRNIRYLVDGTLTTRDFDGFHAGSLECPPNLAVKHILDLSRDLGYAILMVTGRQERWSFLTALWMKENDIAYHELYMRRNSDTRPDTEVKSSILQSLSGRYAVSLAIDDNLSTLPVWINAKIPTIAIGSSGEVLGIRPKILDPADSNLHSALTSEFSVLT